MSLDLRFTNHWNPVDIDPELTSHLNMLADGTYVIDEQEEQQRKRLIDATLLVGATVIAPLLLRPSRVDAGSPVIASPKADVVVIGDSLTVGREKAGLKDVLINSGYNPLFISSYGGRRLVLPGCDTTPVKQACNEYSDGVREVLKSAKQIDDAEVVMLNLGTNDQVGNIQKNLERTIQTIVDVGTKQDNVAPIIVVPEIFGTNPRIGRDTKNEVIHAVAKEFIAKGIKVEVPAYSNFVNSSIVPEGNMAGDNVHLRMNGYKQLIMYDTSVLESLFNKQDTSNTPTIDTTKPDITIPTPNTKPVKVDNNQGSKGIESLVEQLSRKSTEAFILPSFDTYIASKKPVNANMYSLDLVSMSDISKHKVQIAQEIAALPAKELITKTLDQVIKQTPVITQTADSNNNRTENSTSTPEAVSIQEKAKSAGIFYDAATGRAMTTVKSFFMTNEISRPEMREGFGDFRDLPDTGPYLHANSDWHAPLGTTFVSPVPARVIRYDDQYPGQKKSVGNSLVLVLGKDETGNPITIQATHFSEIFVHTGDIVLPGQPLAKAGETGIAYGAHFSVGMTNQSLEPYTNKAHSLNITQYLDFDYACAPSALDDPQESCAPITNPIAIPIDIQVLQSLGLPEYIESDTKVIPEQPVTSTEQNLSDALSTMPIVEEIKVLPDVTEQTNNNAVDQVSNESSTIVPVDSTIPSEQPPTLVDQIEQNNASANTVNDLPTIEDKTTQDPVSIEQPQITDTTPTLPDPNIQTETAQDNQTDVPQTNTTDPTDPATPPTVTDTNITTVDKPEVHSDVNDSSMSDVPKYIYEYLIKNGLTHEGAIGLMANLRAESGLNPTRAQNTWRGMCAVAPERLDPSTKSGEGTKGQGFGLAQWTIVSRQLALQGYADQKNTSWKDIDTQLEYLMIELNSKYFDHVLEVLKTTNDVNAATDIVLTDFENPKVHNFNDRRQRAAELKNLIEAGNFEGIDVSCD